MAHDSDRTPNRLIDEKSPYLQQHAYNPVEWYPWGDEAFERARREEKPIFLSVGYSTCHWCHVMERESFENEETARLMNDLFINIKVDREERPDVDAVYMAACQAVSGNGGWPLSAWLTPDLKPFYVGTYFPPRPAHGRPSFSDALNSLHDAWINERDKVERSAAAIMQAVEKGVTLDAAEGAVEYDPAIVDRCYAQLEKSYDARHGGFSGAPKFPRPAIFEFLLRYYKEHSTHDAGTVDSLAQPYGSRLRGNDSHDTAVAAGTKALEMTLHTMRMMARGGMYDQLGGGFARYSVDAMWRVPHFEKMLYDQGQLLATLADACRISGDEELAHVIRHTVDYLERDLMHESGVFYSAEDADSEGEEGTFYVWTQEKLHEALEQHEFLAVRHYYGITSEGNFEHGKNVLHTSATIKETAEEMGQTEDAVKALLASARRKLFAIRSQRVRPHRDEKILTSWNGLMISGLARASAAPDEPRYAQLASRAADTLMATMNVDGRLMHRLRDGEVRIDGYLDDYAFLAQGLLDLYEVTFDLKYMQEADRLTREAVRLFWDEEDGGFFMTSGDDPSVLVRSKSDHDGAEPSGNSVMAMNLLRLGRLFYDDDLLAKAERTIALFAARVARYPLAMPLMMAAAIAQSHPPRQIIIAASPDIEETARLIRQAHQQYRPDTALVLVKAGGADPWLTERMPAIEGMGPVGGKAAAYVCENFTCQRPVTELEGE